MKSTRPEHDEDYQQDTDILEKENPIVMKDIRELAIAITLIDWTGLEDGNQEAARVFSIIRKEIMCLNKADAINLLLEVMQATILKMMYPAIHREATEFKRMYHAYLSYNPDLRTERDNPDHWYELCVKLDTMAKYRDNKHFGLPMGVIHDLIEPLRQQYLLTEKERL